MLSHGAGSMSGYGPLALFRRLRGDTAGPARVVPMPRSGTSESDREHAQYSALVTGASAAFGVPGPHKTDSTCAESQVTAGGKEVSSPTGKPGAGPAATEGLRLVFGASGYIGSNLVPYLRAAGLPVRAASRQLEVLRARSWENVELVEADALEPATLVKA
jgi:hypothetical protein